MKKILVFLVLVFSLKSFGQYPVKQTLGSDSTVVESKGSLKSRLINKVFSDTSSANSQRIKSYDGAQIVTTTGGAKFWIRDSTLNKWVESGGFNTSIGSGYKIAVNGTNNVKSIVPANGLYGDSTTNGQVEISLGHPLNSPITSMSWTGHREISSDSDFYISNKGAVPYGTTNPSYIRFHPIQDPYIEFSGKHGGGMNIIMTDPSTGAFPAITWYKGANLQAFQGIHWTYGPIDHHFDLIDMRDSLSSAQIQFGGNGIAIFEASGNCYIGTVVGTKRTRFGASNLFPPGQTVSITGSMSLTGDTMLTPGLSRVSDTTGFDVDMINRSTGLHKKMYAGLIGSGGGGGGGIGGSTGSVDNRILRSDGTGGATVQASLVTVDDNGSLDIPNDQAYKIDNREMLHYNNASNNLEIGASPYSVLFKNGGYVTFGSSPSYFDGTGNLGIKVVPTEALDVAGKIQVTSTSEQQRIRYDASNYYSATVGSAGSVSYDATGSSAEFNFKDRVHVVNGSASINVGGSLASLYTDVGNVGSGEDDLMSYSIPAGTLSADGDYIEFEMQIQYFTGAGAPTKQLKVYFGSQLLLNNTSGTAVAFWTIKGTIIRTSATTQRCSLTYNTSSSTYGSSAEYSTPSETLSGAVTLKATGTATNNDDIVMHMMTVKYFPAN